MSGSEQASERIRCSCRCGGRGCSVAQPCGDIDRRAGVAAGSFEFLYGLAADPVTRQPYASMHRCARADSLENGLVEASNTGGVVFDGYPQTPPFCAGLAEPWRLSPTGHLPSPRFRICRSSSSKSTVLISPGVSGIRTLLSAMRLSMNTA